jgi:hypothetical protein
MEKRVFCQLNGNRKVIGILRGYDVRSIPSFIPSGRVAVPDTACRLRKPGRFSPHWGVMRMWVISDSRANFTLSGLHEHCP